MKKIIVGKKDASIQYDFRETCFGIVIKDDKLFCTKKNNDLSLIGGGIEENESQEQTLRREFIEEAGLTIEKMKPLCTIDCYWFTKDKRDMESLTNIYIVEVSNKIVEPTEKGHELVTIEFENAIELLPLPYQKRAIEEFIKERGKN